MNILREVAQELLKMFIADARLTLSILALVALTAVLIKFAGMAPAGAGAILLVGCLMILLAAVFRQKRQ